MKQYNILQVIPNFDLAGAEIMCENLSEYLYSKEQYNVFVCSLFTTHTPITDRLESAGIHLSYLDKKFGLDARMIFRLADLMKLHKIDIVHTHLSVMVYAIPAAIVAKVPVRVHTVHNIAQKEVNGIHKIFARWFYKYCHVKPVSISPLITRSIISQYSLNDQSVAMVFNGKDLTKCVVKEDYRAHQVFRFIHIGRFSEQKNHEMIIEAALQMKKMGRVFSIELIGKGEKEENIKSLVADYGLSDYIHFLGVQTDVYPFISQADCFILPSLYEGMPVSLVEAMGCATPIIASAVGGVPDMIDNRISGILISPLVEELVSAMCEMMDSSDSYREKIGRTALQKSRLFSLENMGMGYEEIYQKEIARYGKCRE